LTSIRDEDHLTAAFAVLNDLTARKLDTGGNAYVLALSDLVEVYEDIHHPISPAPPADVLQGCIDDNGYTPATLAAELGIPRAAIAGVLAGERELTAVQIDKLCKRFRLSPAAFLPGAG
jgi:HTH-type transcriptional regulator/antitoxin HigA